MKMGKNIFTLFLFSLLIAPWPALSAELTDLPNSSPGVGNLDKEPLIITGVEPPKNNMVSTTYGGASLKVSDSYLEINAGADKNAYSAGLAGYNAPVDGGSATTFENVAVWVRKGNLTSGMDSDARTSGSMLFDNGLVHLEGGAKNEAVIYGYGLSPEIRQIIDVNKTSITAQNGYGTILTNNGTVNVNDGSNITVGTRSSLYLNTGVWKPDGIATAEAGADNTSIYNINSGGALKAENGQILSDNPTQLEINLANGGNITAAGGGINLQTDWKDGASLNANGAIDISRNNAHIWVGQLNIGDGAQVNVTGTADAASENWATLSGYKGVNISGGEIKLGAGAEIQAGSTQGMQISGGEITLAGSGAPGEAGSSQLRFSGKGDNQISGGKITVAKDSQGTLALGGGTTMSGGELSAQGTLYLAGSDIGSGGTENPETYGLDMNDGSIAVEEGGALAVTNDLKMNVDGGRIDSKGTVQIGAGKNAELNFLGADAQTAFDNLTQAGKVELGGAAGQALLSFNGDIETAPDNFVQTASKNGQIAVGAESRFQTSGALTLTGTESESILNIAPTGVIAANSINIAGAPLSVTSGGLLVTGAKSGALTGEGVTISSDGRLTFGDAATTGQAGGTINLDVTNEGRLVVASGDWVLGADKTIEAKSGSMQIGGITAGEGTTAAASLDVRQGTLKSGADGTASDGTVSTGIGIMDGGTLIGDFSQFFEGQNSEAALLDTARQIYLAENGTLTIANATADTLADLETYRGKLLADDPTRGTVNWDNLTLTRNPVPGIAAEKVAGNNVFANNDLEYGQNNGTDDGSYDAATKTVAVAATSSIGGKTIVLQGDAANDAERMSVGGENGNTLTLLGETAATNLITSGDVGGEAAPLKEVTVQPNATLKLGSESLPDQKQGGILGSDVSLADGASLETAAGDFSTGKITALEDAAAQVVVKAGSSLTAPVLGTQTSPIDTVDNSGKLNIANDIIAKTITNAGNLVAGNLTADNLTSASGSLDLGSLAIGTKETPGQAVISGGALTAKSLAVAGRMNVGGTGAAPTVNVTAADLGSGRLVFDHSGTGMTTGKIGSFGASGADMDVLRNAVVTVGPDAPADWVAKSLPKTGLTASNNGAYNSVLAVYSPLTLKSGGSISVGGDLAAPATQGARMLSRAANAGAGARETAGNTVVLGNKAILMVDGPNAASGDGAIIPSAAAQGSKTAIARVSPGAKVAITGARPESSYTVFGVNPQNKVGWSVVNSEDESKPGLTKTQVVTDNPLMNDFTVVMTPDGALRIESSAATPAALVFPSVDSQLAAVMDAAFANNQIGVTPEFTHAGQRGTQFLSRALVMANNGLSDEAGRALESAGRMLTLGAAPQMTLTANRAAGSAITQRTTLAEPVGNLYAVNSQGEQINRPQKEMATALWIMPLFQSTNGFSMDAGPHDYDFSGRLGGVALGIDYTVNDLARFGVAFNIGGGYAEGSGTLNKTTNDMNFWGVGAYAATNQDNFGLTADVFYTSTYNKLRQDTPAAMEFGKLKTDVRGHAISTGLRAEYKIPTEAMDIVPHAGFRYTNLKMDSYKVKSAGKVLKGNATEQNIWQFPVGVTMTRVVELDQGWRFKPLLDLNVTPAAGDFKTKGKVRFTGTDTKAELKTKVLDYITYGGTVGLEFENDNLSVGVSYSGEFGEETSAHGVFGTLRYEF